MNTIRTPGLPMDCIDLANPGALGLACEGCALLPDCAALRAGQTIVEQTTRIEELTIENEANIERAARILERLLNLRTDSLVEVALTPEGLRDTLANDEEVQEAMQKGDWGVIRLDGRFVRHVNRFGNVVGDDFLHEGGIRIASVANGLARFGDRRLRSQGISGRDRRTSDRRQPVPDQAQGRSANGDIFCRQGGDEFALVLLGLKPAGLITASARIQNALTVNAALENYANQKVPFIASVGHAHTDSMHADVMRLINGDNYWGAFNLINSEADEGQRTVKGRQYREMWELVRDATPGHPQFAVAMPDDAVVASEFLRVLCPDFHHDPIGFLRRSHELYG